MELLIYLILFLFVLIISTTTNKILPFCPFLLSKFFWGLGLVYLFPRYGLISIQSCFWPWLWSLTLPGAEEADITSFWSTGGLLSFWSFLWFLSRPCLGAWLTFFGWSSSFGCLFSSWSSASGPTDLVAFASLSERFRFPNGFQYPKGEGLLNDASGFGCLSDGSCCLDNRRRFLSMPNWNPLALSILWLFEVVLTAMVNRFTCIAFLLSVRAIDISQWTIARAKVCRSWPFHRRRVSCFRDHRSSGCRYFWRPVALRKITHSLRVRWTPWRRPFGTPWPYAKWISLCSHWNGIRVDSQSRSCLILSTIPFFYCFRLSFWPSYSLRSRFVMIAGFTLWGHVDLRKKFLKYTKDMLLLTFSGVKGDSIYRDYSPHTKSFGAGVSSVTLSRSRRYTIKLSNRFTGPPSTYPEGNKREAKDHLMHIAILNDVAQN